MYIPSENVPQIHKVRSKLAEVQLSEIVYEVNILLCLHWDVLF